MRKVEPGRLANAAKIIYGAARDYSTGRLPRTELKASGETLRCTDKSDVPERAGRCVLDADIFVRNANGDLERPPYGKMEV